MDKKRHIYVDMKGKELLKQSPLMKQIVSLMSMKNLILVFKYDNSTSVFLEVLFHFFLKLNFKFSLTFLLSKCNNYVSFIP